MVSNKRADLIMHHRAVFANEEGVRPVDGEVVGAFDAVGACGLWCYIQPETGQFVLAEQGDAIV